MFIERGDPPNSPTHVSDLSGASARLLNALLDSSEDGVLILRSEMMVRVNRAAASLLQRPESELLGAPLSFIAPWSDRSVCGQHAAGSIEVGPADARRTIALRAIAVNGVLDEQVVLLRDVTDAEEQERQLIAFTRMSNRVASHHPLEVVVDQLAEEVRQASGMAMCTVVTLDAVTGAATQAGKAGLPDDYGDRLEACRANGAPLLTTYVQQTGKTMVVPGYRSTLLADSRFEPLHDVVGPQEWDEFVAVPLLMRNRNIGALTGFLETGKSLNDRQVQFLGAMANHAAVAIENCVLLGQMQAKAALEERHRLARELHDTVSQSLFSLNLHARAAQIALEQTGMSDRHAVVRDLQAVIELANGASSAMGQLIHHLRPEALLREGLRAAVEMYAQDVATREGITIATELPDNLPLDSEVELSLFRLMQEAVHNAVKHASASRIEISMTEPRSAWGTLIVTVEDDGCGFDQSAVPLGRLGLATMRERAVGLGGTVLIDSPAKPEGGTRVRAHLPNVLNRVGLGAAAVTRKRQA